MAAGAAQTVITKSGTNQLKGSAFLFLNKDAFNTNTYFNDYFDLPKPGVDTKTFGGTAGGPVKKNKLFYFASWERYDTTRPTTYSYTVPTAKMRAGDFSEVGAAYPTFRLFNPFSGTAGAGREQWTDFKIPSQRLSPIAQNIMGFYPAVNSDRDLNIEPPARRLHQLRESSRSGQRRLKINWQIEPVGDALGQGRIHEQQGSRTTSVLGFDNRPSGTPGSS
jgi:hypothetical protein